MWLLSWAHRVGGLPRVRGLGRPSAAGPPGTREGREECERTGLAAEKEEDPGSGPSRAESRPLWPPPFDLAAAAAAPEVPSRRKVVALPRTPAVAPKWPRCGAVKAPDAMVDVCERFESKN